MDKIPNIIIIEDHPVMRGGLVSYFTGTRRWNVLGAVSNIDDAKILLSSSYCKHSAANPNTSADLILIDIQLEDGWGLDIIPWFKEQPFEKIKMPVFAVYTAYDDFSHINAALSMCVQGYICKRRSEPELENALFKILEGRIYIDDSVKIKLDTNAKLINLLTKRETEILTYVKNNLSNSEIASRLGISKRTVENILSCVYYKTGIQSRLELQRL
ncbi:MAG: response regulator transcription factor [Treponema sp.]|nr:response regulator transcription factor [Treponema sp.]